MKALGVVIVALILVFAFTGLQDVRADQEKVDKKSAHCFTQGVLNGCIV